MGQGALADRAMVLLAPHRPGEPAIALPDQDTRRLSVLWESGRVSFGPFCKPRWPGPPQQSGIIVKSLCHKGFRNGFRNGFRELR